MKHCDLEQFVKSINLMTDVSGELIRRLRHTNIVPQIKIDASPVTSVDREVESSIREIIAKLHPDHGICGEEFDDTAINSEFIWVIDPIDGTLAFLAGFPVFGTLIVLLHNQKPILGVIDMPVTAERWIGGIDRPTTCNNKPVRVRSCNNINQAMLSASNPDFYDDQTLPALLALKNSSQLNVYGGSCMAYALIWQDFSGHISKQLFYMLHRIPLELRNQWLNVFSGGYKTPQYIQIWPASHHSLF